MNHKGTCTLETERLILRCFTPTDADAAFRNWTSCEAVTHFLRWPPHPSIKITKYVLDDWIHSYTDPQFYQWAIVIKETNEPIGAISVVALDDKVGKLNIGYCIGETWWNCGYTTEAFQRIITFFFEEVHANRIEAQHDPANPGSGRVMVKCGLKLEGILRQADWNNRGIVDACMHALTASEYFANKSI